MNVGPDPTFTLESSLPKPRARLATPPRPCAALLVVSLPVGLEVRSSQVIAAVRRMISGHLAFCKVLYWIPLNAVSGRD